MFKKRINSGEMEFLMYLPFRYSLNNNKNNGAYDRAYSKAYCVLQNLQC